LLHIVTLQTMNSNTMKEKFKTHAAYS